MSLDIDIARDSWNDPYIRILRDGKEMGNYSRKVVEKFLLILLVDFERKVMPIEKALDLVKEKL